MKRSKLIIIAIILLLGFAIGNMLKLNNEMKEREEMAKLERIEEQKKLEESRKRKEENTRKEKGEIQEELKVIGTKEVYLGMREIFIDKTSWGESDAIDYITVNMRPVGDLDNDHYLDQYERKMVYKEFKKYIWYTGNGLENHVTVDHNKVIKIETCVQNEELRIKDKTECFTVDE